MATITERIRTRAENKRVKAAEDTLNRAEHLVIYYPMIYFASHHVEQRGPILADRIATSTRNLLAHLPIECRIVPYLLYWRVLNAMIVGGVAGVLGFCFMTMVGSALGSINAALGAGIGGLFVFGIPAAAAGWFKTERLPWTPQPTWFAVMKDGVLSPYIPKRSGDARSAEILYQSSKGLDLEFLIRAGRSKWRTYAIAGVATLLVAVLIILILVMAMASDILAS